jgi:hypothetical protein
MLLSTMNCDGGSVILPRMEIGRTDLGRWGWGWRGEYGPSLKLTVKIGQLHTNFESWP